MANTNVLKRVWGASLILLLMYPTLSIAQTKEIGLKQVIDSIAQDDALTSAHIIVDYESRYPTTKTTRDELTAKWELKWKKTKGPLDQFLKGAPLIPLKPPLKPLGPTIDPKEAERIYQQYTIQTATVRTINEDALEKQNSAQLKKDIAALDAYLARKPASLSKAELYYRMRLLDEMNQYLTEKQTVDEKPLDKKAQQFINAYTVHDRQGVNINNIMKKPLNTLKQEEADLSQYLDAVVDIAAETRALLSDILTAIKQVIKTKSEDITSEQESIARLLEKYIVDGEPVPAKVAVVSLEQLKSDKDKLVKYYARIEDLLGEESRQVYELLKELNKAIQTKSTKS